MFSANPSSSRPKIEKAMKDGEAEADADKRKAIYKVAFNRINEMIPGVRTSGQILLDGQDIYAPDVDPVAVRRRVGMVFQKPNPFPKSIFENVAYGPRIHGVRERATLQYIVEKSLKSAALWEEVKDRLFDPALSLSGGQQQRLRRRPQEQQCGYGDGCRLAVEQRL